MALFAASAYAQTVDVLVNHNGLYPNAQPPLVVNGATGPAGGDFTYQVITQLNALNGGASQASNVVMTQKLPVDAIFRSITSPDGITCTPALADGTVITAANQDFSCSIGALSTVGDTRTVNFNVTLPSVETSKWRAFASATATETDSDQTNNRDLDRNITTTKAADLGIVLAPPAVSPTQYAPFNYTATVTNHGPSTIPQGGSVQVRFSVPVGTTGSTPNGSGWTCTPAGAVDQAQGTAFTCSYPAGTAGIAKGDALPVLNFPLKATVTGSVSASATVEGFDAGGGGTVPFADAVDTNNTDTKPVTIAADSNVDVYLTKWNDRPTNAQVVDAAEATNVNWTLRVTRQSGSTEPAGVRVVDTLPAGVDFVSFSGANWDCSYAPGTRTVACDYTGTAPAVGNPYPNITVATRVPAGLTVGATLENVGVVSATNECASCNNAGNTDTSTLTVSNTVTMAVTKSSSLAVVKEGEAFTYTITASNTGALNIPVGHTVTVVDSVPQYVQITGASAGWTCSPTPTPATPFAGPGDLTCTTTDGIAAGTSRNLVLNAKIAGLPAGYTNAIINNAAITGVGPGRTFVPVNNSVTVNASPKVADLGITKAANKGLNGQYESGETVTYTLVVTNHSTGADAQRSTGITVRDALTNLVTSNHGRPRLADGSYDPAVPAGPWPQGGFISSSVVINGGASNGSACTNSNGGGTGNGAISGGATNDARTWTCNGMELEPGASATITLVVKHFAPDITTPATTPAGYGRQTNTATVSSGSVRDENPSNDEGETTILVLPITDLTVFKSATPKPAKAGEPIDYSISLRNLGPSSARGVTMTDSLPSNGFWVGGSLVVSNGGTCSMQPVNGGQGGQLVCSWSNPLANAEQYTVSYKLRSAGDVDTTATPAPKLDNSVEVDTTTKESNENNNTAVESVPLTRTELDVLINMSHNKDAIALGDTTEYTITVTNNGPAFATNVVMTDVFPGVLNPSVSGSPGSSATFSWQGGLSVVSSLPGSTLVPLATACPALTNGATSGPLVCNLGTMAPNEAITIKFTMRADSLPQGKLTGTIFHNARVSATEEGLTDPALNVLANNNANDRTSTRDPSVPPGSIENADLSLDKEGTSTALAKPGDVLNAGDTVTYTLTVKNEETDPTRISTNGVLKDVLPKGLTLLGTPAGCTYDNATREVSCPVGTLNPGATRIFTVTATLDSPYTGPRPLVNRAKVTALGDPNEGNNTDEKTLPVKPQNPASIPTLSEWGLILMSLLLAAFALRRMPLQAGRR